MTEIPGRTSGFAKSAIRLASCAAAGLFLCASASLAQAEGTVSVYSGFSFSPHSTVDYDFNNGTSGTVSPGWDTETFEYPPYWGARATWWFDQAPEWGVAVDFTHAKVAADIAGGPLFDVLEFTDGINFLTANLTYRYQLDDSPWTPYAGIGAGIAFPHVEVQQAGSSVKTYEYQVTGAAFQAFAGIDYAFDENWSIFGEFKSGYAMVEADLTGGGSLETDVISNQVILGISYKIF